MSDHEHHVLIIGAGSIGERHLRCFLNTGRAKVSFVEVRDELRAEIATRYSDTTAYCSLEAAFEKTSGIDCAVVATPAPLHVQQATFLLKQGLHVLIEKPLSLNLQGIDELLQIAENSGQVAAVAYVYRAHPVLGQMREALHSGRYGKPVELIVSCGQNFPTYRPAYRETYYRSRETGGGAIQDALTHMINASQWLVGDVSRVVADAEQLVLDGVEVEDTVHVLARHGNVLANYVLNQHQPNNETIISVICERGTLRFEGHNQRWRVMEQPDTPWQDSAEISLQRDTLFEYQAEAFLDATEGKSPALCDLKEGISSMKVNLAILQSLESESWQTVGSEELN